MHNSPAVSVIVPVYNSEKYLTKCLDSLVNQTLSNIEIVAVDDGSTDRSSSILDEYNSKYPEMFTVLHEKNGGQGRARNKAIKTAHGKYLAFLDADDYSKTDRFEKLVDYAEKNNADFVGSGFSDILETDTEEKFIREALISSKSKTNKEMYFELRANPLFVFIKREIILENDIYFTEGCIYEDTAFWLKLIPYIVKPVILEESLAYHVFHANSSMTTIRAEKIRNIFPVVRDAVEFYKKKELLNEYGEYLEYFCSRILLCSNIDRISRCKSGKYRKKLVKETYEVLKELFPSYKKNKYILGKKNFKNLYIRFSSEAVSGLLIFLIRKGLVKGTSSEYVSAINKTKN